MGALLATLSLGVAVVFAAFVVRPRCGRLAAATHALMGLGMAAMFSPWGDPVPPSVGVCVFAALALWFGARLLRGVPTGAGGAAHLVVAPAAMAAMYLSHGHGGHHAGGVALAALWLGLAGYFGWHAAASVGRVQQAWAGVPAGDGAVVAPPGPAAVGGAGRARRDERPDGGDVPHRALIRGRPESLHELGRIADVGRSAPSTRRSRRRTSSARVRARSRRSLWVGRRRAPGGAAADR